MFKSLGWLEVNSLLFQGWLMLVWLGRRSLFGLLGIFRDAVAVVSVRLLVRFIMKNGSGLKRPE